VFTVYNVSEQNEDPSLSPEEQENSETLFDMDVDDVTLGLALKVALN